MLRRRFLSLLLLPLIVLACADRLVPLEPESRVETRTFSYTPPPEAPAITSISIPGSFNDWSTGALPMERQMDGSWQATVQLEPGRHEYKFFINGAWPSDMCGDRTWGDPQNDFWIDPGADGCLPDGHDGQNAIVNVGDVEAVQGLGFVHDASAPAYVSGAGGRVSVRFHANRDEVRAARVIADGVEYPAHRQLSYGMREVWRASLQEGTTTYRIVIDEEEGPQEFGPYTVSTRLFREVPWVGRSVGYQIFPERFWNGDPANDSTALATDAYNYMHQSHAGSPPVITEGWGGELLESHCCHQYFGGDLQGIREKLDHLGSMGVTLIYLNPIFLAGSAHGYDTSDYLRVAPSFGDERLLRVLLDEAHARGMRVMWDFVPNHVGVGHWAFQDAVGRGEASPYWNWFRFHVPAGQVEVGNGKHYDGWWGLGSLPELQTSNPEVFRHLLDITRHWTAFGFDGIRVDVPSEIQNRAEFFPAFRDAAKAINPEVYLVGEIWQRSPSWLRGDEFDALMNYAIGHGVIERFAIGAITGGTAEREMAQLYAEYPEASAAMAFNLVSSHDTPRMLTKMGGGQLGQVPSETAKARQRLASALLFALPGVPVTFQGDECAFLGGEPRDGHRYPMQWQSCDAGMLAHYTRLSVLKRTFDALRSPVIRAHRGEGTFLSFYRGEPGRGEILAVFNNGEESRSFVLPGGDWADVGSGAAAPETVEVEGLGWRYFERQ